MYSEIPVEIKVNPMTKVFMFQHEKEISQTLERLRGVDIHENLTKNVKNLGDNLEDLNTMILTLHDTNKKQQLEKTTINATLVDFMGTILKGLNHSKRIKDNTQFNLTNIKLAEHFNKNSNAAHKN